MQLHGGTLLHLLQEQVQKPSENPEAKTRFSVGYAGMWLRGMMGQGL